MTFNRIGGCFALGLRRSGAPVDVYCAILGHSAITGLRHYATVTPGDQRDAQQEARDFLRNRKPRHRKRRRKRGK